MYDHQAQLLGQAAPGGAAQQRAASGLYCSTSGTVMTDREALQAHYQSDFHRWVPRGATP